MEPTRIRFAGYQPPESVHSRAATVFGNTLSAALGEGVQFGFETDITASGSKAADLLVMTEAGDIDLCYFASSYLAGRVPELELLDLPFTIDDREQAYALLDGIFGAHVAARVAATTGYRVLGFWDNGFRHFSNAVRPIRSPADCRGLRIRTLSSELHRQTFAALGFEPVTLDVRELPRAVADGRVDAQENPLTTFHVFKLHEHHRYITLSRHFFGTALLLCNAPAYRRWPADVRAAVERAAADSTIAQRGFAAAEDQRVLSVLTRHGSDVTTLSPSQRRAFAEALAPLIARCKEKHGKTLPASLS